MLPYLSGLTVASILVLFSGLRFGADRGQLWRSMAAIALNWLAGMLWKYTTADPAPWEFNILIDALAAFAVLYHPAGRAQSYIGLFYLIQIACHLAFGGREVLSYPNDSGYYYDAITWIAWAQLVAMGAWCSGIWGKLLLSGSGHRGNAPDRRKAVFYREPRP